MGAYSDSYYEYLLKSFLQSGRSADLAYSRDLWLNSARETQAKLLQPLFVQNFREGGGIFLTSLAFAALHGAAAFLPVLALSLLLGVIYLRTRSLVAVGVVHAMHNSLVLTLFFNFPEWRELSGASVFLAC